MQAQMMISKQQIGRCGELLVQLELLRAGIESAPMTTDSGIDLVAYSGRNRKPVTIQVKTNLKPKPGGGKGKMSLGWWLADESPADVCAFVDLSSSAVWLFKTIEVAKHAQQHSSGRYQLYMYVDETVKSHSGRPVLKSQFSKYLLGSRIDEIF
jgi:hypothetical protein